MPTLGVAPFVTITETCSESAIEDMEGRPKIAVAALVVALSLLLVTPAEGKIYTL
jgi:hypothetical protein